MCNLSFQYKSKVRSRSLLTEACRIVPTANGIVCGEEMLDLSNKLYLVTLEIYTPTDLMNISREWEPWEAY